MRSETASTALLIKASCHALLELRLAAFDFVPRAELLEVLVSPGKLDRYL